MAHNGQRLWLEPVPHPVRLCVMSSTADPTPSPTGCLLVVGGRVDTVRKAVGLGLDVILLQHRDYFHPETAALAKGVIIADYTDWASVEPLIVAAHQVYGFTAAISLTEPGLEPVGRINDLFGLRGDGREVSRLLQDKLAMRRHLALTGGSAAGLSIAAAAADSEASLHTFGQEHGYPFIVKPANMTASVGVHRVDRAEQIPEVWQAVLALRERTDLSWRRYFDFGAYLVEEYLSGPEYSVEAFSFDGRHVVVSVTEKLVDPGGFVELGHAEPARIDPGTQDALIGCAQTFLDAIGQRNGASHTEIKMTPTGPKIIEGHNRIGGDRIVDLLELAYGVDFELLTVGWPFRLVDELPERPKPLRAAATRFLTAGAGVVREVTGAEEVRAADDVFALDLVVAPGSVVRPGSNWDRAGQVIATAEDTDTAVRRCAELISRIDIRTEPAPPDGATG